MTEKSPIPVQLARREFDEFRKDYVELKRHEQFELFTAYCVIRGYEHDRPLLEGGRIGAGGDGGIDWIYLVINNRIISLLDPIDTEHISRNTEIELIFGQAKEETGWKASVGEKFQSTFSDFLGSHSGQTVRRYSSDLRIAIDNFLEFWYEVAKKRPTLSIRLVQASFGVGNPHRDVYDSMKLAAQEIAASFKPVVPSVEILGAEELFDRYSSTPTYDASLKYVEELEQGNDKIALVRLSDYYNFLSDDEGRLNEHFFEDNVRDYESGVTVNKQILHTLDNPSESTEFWWLNNGVTMLVSRPPVSSRKEYSLSDVQIVNGLQTSQTIYNWAASQKNLDQDDRTVLVRIIAPDNEDEKSRIIRATNSQTPVSKASLRATDEIHRRIEDILALNGLYYDRRKNYYKNHGKSPREIVSITLLSQAMISAFLLRPDTARARPSSFLDNEETYKKIFDNRDLSDFSWAAATQKLVDDVLAAESYASSARNNLRFYVLLAMRALGSSIIANKALWAPLPCSNEWTPQRAQVSAAAQWILAKASDVDAEASPLDQVFKGSSLKGSLEAEWPEVFDRLKVLKDPEVTAEMASEESRD